MSTDNPRFPQAHLQAVSSTEAKVQVDDLHDAKVLQQAQAVCRRCPLNGTQPKGGIPVDRGSVWCSSVKGPMDDIEAALGEGRDATLHVYRGKGFTDNQKADHLTAEKSGCSAKPFGETAKLMPPPPVRLGKPR